MSQPTTGKLRFRLFDRVKTDDARMHIRQAGFVKERPGDARGDSVNVLCFGGRLDAVTEFLDERRDSSVRTAAAVQNAEVAEAQAAAGDTVTAPVVDVATV